MKLYILSFICLVFACNDPQSNYIESERTVNDSLTVPDNAYVCFDSSFSGKMGARIYKLGDSIKKIQQLLEVIPLYPHQDTLYASKNPIVKRSKSGATTTRIFAYFRNSRLYRFVVTWEFKGKFIEDARLEFYSIVQKSTMGCLWEESINIYEASDTLRSYYNSKFMTEYISRFTDSSWQIQFECRAQ